MRINHVFLILVLTVMVSVPGVAQKTPSDKTKPQEVPGFKILSTRFITEAKSLWGSSWVIKTAERTGLVVAVEASFTSEHLAVKPESYFIEYGEANRLKEECIGLHWSTDPKLSDWMLVETGANAFLNLPRNEKGNASFALLFTVSKTITDFTLVYRHSVTVAKAVVTK